VWGSVREWTLTLPGQLPLWEMESRWTPKTLESNCRGQNSMACGVVYIIGKLLEPRFLKWARIAHLDIWNVSYGQKKGRESNCQFDSRPQKVGNRPDLLSCRRRATYRWKAIDESYNFALDPTSIEGLLAKLWGSKVAGILVGGISGLPLRSPRKKSHLDVASAESCRVYYKGEGGGFPQVRAMVSLVCPCCPWLVPTPSVLQLCTNHFVWVVCRAVWVSEACQLFLVPSRSSNTPLYPSKCCELGSVLRLLLLPLLSTWAHIWVPSGVGSASKWVSQVTVHSRWLFCLWYFNIASCPFEVNINNVKTISWRQFEKVMVGKSNDGKDQHAFCFEYK
jgi:hypothetical protein